MKLLTRKPMCYSSLLLAASFSLITILTACASTTNSAEESKYYFLRHAEINKKNPDKPLTNKGNKRAESLVQHFNGNITHIYATHTDRTYNTVAPLAKNRGISITQVPKQGQVLKDKTVTNRTKGKVAIKPMIKALKGIQTGSSVVISANSGNMFAIMAGLGVQVVGDKACTSNPQSCLPCKNKKCFPKKEFNNIWMVTVSANGKVSLQRSKYGN